MTVNPVFAPYAQTYTQHEPYLTAPEYYNSPNSVAVNNLLGDMSQASNAQALNLILKNASGWVDQICHQVLAATVEVAASDGYRIDRYGTMLIPVPFSPVVQVNGFARGPNPQTLTEVTDLTGIGISRKVVKIPSSLIRGPGRYSQLTYVAGYANAFLTDAVFLGGYILPVDNALAAVPGMNLTVTDPNLIRTEVVTVASTTGNTITTVAPLSFDHPAGVNVSALPPAVKQAVTFLATSLIKRTGSMALAIQTVNSPPNVEQAFPSGGAELALAKGMLVEFARVT